MDNTFNQIQELLHQRAELYARLKLIPYDGTAEVKPKGNEKYLYIRKRIAGKLTSTYVAPYSDELYQLLLKNTKESRAIKKEIRAVDKQLAVLGYVEAELTPEVILNLDFARANMKSNIYDQAILEGVTTTFPQTESIIDNGEVNGMTPTDVQKILNLKHAWEFILDKDVLLSDSSYYILCRIAKLVNEGFYDDGGRIRGVPVTIGGSSYIPPLPIETIIMEQLSAILSLENESIDVAIEVCLYCMKTQIFNDGNKRAAIIFANHYLISHGGGLLVIPEKKVSQFKKLLVDYYEDKGFIKIKDFLKQECWKRYSDT